MESAKILKGERSHGLPLIPSIKKQQKHQMDHLEDQQGQSPAPSEITLGPIRRQGQTNFFF